MPEHSLLDLQQSLLSHKELYLADAVMLGEIPASTGDEAKRNKYVAQRFAQSSLEHISIDEEGNCQGLIRGSEHLNPILVTAHADTHLDIPTDQRVTVNVDSEAMTGMGLSDNTIGLAALAALPDLLDKLGIKLRHDLLLLSHVNSLGSKDLAGLHFFLDNYQGPIHSGIVVEGTTLGRLNHSCFGMVQAEITCKVQQDPNSRWEQSENAIILMHRILRKILEIPLPQEPRTSLIIGSIRSGRTFNRPPDTATLRFEIRSEEPGRARDVRLQIESILEELGAATHSECTIEYSALRKPGGIPFSHPFVTAHRKILSDLEITPVLGPSYSDLSALILKEIPAITLGLSTARHLNEPGETVDLPPLFTGLTQLIALILEIDQSNTETFSA